MSFWSRSLARLFEQHRRQLMSMAGRYLQDREVADELVQDVYVRMMQAGSAGNAQEDTKVLYASVRNAAIDHHRTVKNRARVMERVLPSQMWGGETSSPEQHAEARQALGALDRALLELSPRAREMFLLHRVEGVSNQKLARKYGISVSAVEKQLARAMRHCQEKLSAHRRDV